MPEQTVGQRISQLIAYLGISKNAFAASLDKTATVIQHLVDERNKPGFDLLCKIFEVYPNVSKDWLMQGKGTMLADAEPAPQAPKEPASIPRQEKSIAATESEPANMYAAPAPTGPIAAPPVEETAPPANAPAAPASAPTVAAAPAPVVAPSVAAALPAFAAATLPPTPVAPPAPVVDPTASLQAALYAQQLTHQLALAEMRNQHLQEQQRMMQQMMEMMQRQLSR